MMGKPRAKWYSDVPEGIVAGAVVEFRVLSGSESEPQLGHVRGLSLQGVSFDVIRALGERGARRLTTRFIPFAHLDATVVDGEGIGALLDHFFRPRSPFAGTEGRARAFDRDVTLDLAWRDLLEEYVKRQNALRVFTLLDHFCGCMDRQALLIPNHASQHVTENQQRWACAFRWRSHMSADPALASIAWLMPLYIAKSGGTVTAVEQILAALKARLKEYWEHSRINASWLDRHSLMAVLLWELLATCSEAEKSHESYMRAWESLLTFALTLDRGAGGFPEFWGGGVSRRRTMVSAYQ